MTDIDNQLSTTESGRLLISEMEGEIKEETKIVKKTFDASVLHAILQKRLYEKKKKKNIIGFGNVYFIPDRKSVV